MSDDVTMQLVVKIPRSLWEDAGLDKQDELTTKVLAAGVIAEQIVDLANHRRDLHRFDRATGRTLCPFCPPQPDECD
jgi:hypothetical protein